MPTISPGDGGGGGGGGGGFSGSAAAGSAVAGGTGRVILPPGGQEIPLEGTIVPSRSAPCPGCTESAADTTCFGAECDGGGDSDWTKYILRGGFGRFFGGGGPGGGEPGGRGGGVVHIVPVPPTSPPPGGGGPIGGGNPGGSQGVPLQGAAGRGSAGFTGRGGIDLNRFLGGLLDLLGVQRPTEPPRVFDPTGVAAGALEAFGSSFSTGTPGFGSTGVTFAPPPPPPPSKVLERERHLLKRVPGSFELPEEEDRERKRRRRDYSPPPVFRSNRPR
jgi:hypothetical protein